ncbi:hypothetical protein ABZ671_01055 [Micromonospora sp. NPDC006766]|uniref:hypothetical protein n=1 Tax=Micromonospora sp. NPDC006766 TaxID=3154778 RepID=UPI0033FBC26C
MTNEGQRWDVQGFYEGESSAGWSTGLTGDESVIDYLRSQLAESDAAVFLIRRGAQVDVYDAPEVEPFRLLDMRTARDRLARHLHLAGTELAQRAGRADAWDNRPEHVDKQPAYQQADDILAALLGEEGVDR